MLVSTAASIVGVALVVNAVFVLVNGHWDTALMRAGLGLYSCIWAFIPYDEFLRVAGKPLRLGDSAEQNAYATLLPARLGLLTFLAMILMITGLVHNVISAFR
jgi:hypothetical protein